MRVMYEFQQQAPVHTDSFTTQHLIFTYVLSLYSGFLPGDSTPNSLNQF